MVFYKVPGAYLVDSFYRCQSHNPEFKEQI